MVVDADAEDGQVGPVHGAKVEALVPRRVERVRLKHTCTAVESCLGQPCQPGILIWAFPSLLWIYLPSFIGTQLVIN